MGQQHSIRRRIALAAGPLMLIFIFCGCVSPAINADGYRGKVGHSAQRMVGIIGSARLAAVLDLQGKVLDTVADETISDAEQDAQSVITSLDSVQPPDRASITLRTQADQVLQDASSQLSDLRIAQRRGDQASMRHTLGELATTLTAVQKLQDQT